MGNGDGEKNKGGRPKVAPEDRAICVSVSLTVRQYERLCREAEREHVSASALLRSMLARYPGF